MTQGTSDPREWCLKNDSSALTSGYRLARTDDLIRRLSTHPGVTRYRCVFERTKQAPPNVTGSPKKEEITMTIIAEDFEFVVGVDTHARTHTFTAIHCATGALVDTAVFPATDSGMNRALVWIRRRTGGRTVFAAVEGTSSYGARLTRILQSEGVDVGEVRPPARSSRAMTGKSDPIDAEAAARSVLGRQRDHVITPRATGTRKALRILLASRSLLDQQRTANRNALTALLRSTDLGIDVRASLREAQITVIAAWRTSHTADAVARIARAEAKRLALAIKDITGQLAENHKALAQLAEELAPGLQSVPGVGPVTAAIILCAYSHRGRIRSEAAFAALGGVAPRPASSGNTTRHRLNRSGTANSTVRSMLSSEPA